MGGEQGNFIAVEGPNGVGKSSVAGLLGAELDGRSLSVLVTQEPTRSALGLALRELEAELSGLALALGCAADRTDHVERVVCPALARGETVISDRYVASSLILQRVGGATIEQIWAANAHLPAATLTLFLDDDPDSISERRAGRGAATPLEAQVSAEREVELSEDARAFLAAQGWECAVVDCRGKDAPSTVADCLTELQRRGLLGGGS